ncbi:ribosomal protein S3 [Ehrlichia chaffeensis str. Heartland]|uniref:Small ribosomal subunit protein uS3 n=1 Tax=Ehrlichia chaffeensis (strain ATCC CRL-10679 / Arkansas) TaxID=205920 RepID=RS3_EHRCR|nr:30S ribosomal protein S3 [Ehrlichia chaffeensis]Q2GH50.1 RecName: Full=Small ribosomal subunit protein uS3; AltName: Full=30S ribosomal protein S3 [Ehrlichia chaffeensis str. Arkansas]ABD45551.1 ribosomal protein S3 [Ehrlichia chaffeensis str. Arkansas]AHX03517.1 ribosomal protein S3 [Ehrlichia chaffeensis str. Heartland]AHX05762.1 ribosomal protein S3 [Ehrlichia chaffeensis str. Jax]AHX06754.1 ribosomal protein S3 [Ehrlichia chaffeensis str. Liberty]AHX07107.1 ribosomal protein S3 [Ehrlic
MGQKSNPIGLRLKIINTWDSLWYANKDYTTKLHEDFLLRKFIKKAFYHASISKVVIARKVDVIMVNVYSAKPGVIIGKKGADIDKVKQQIVKMINNNIELNIIEVKKPELKAVLIAENIAQQLEKRISFRRAMKRSVQSCLKIGAKGIKVSCAGRLGGAEIARTEWYKEGSVPLHTFRANIDYGFSEAKTIYGIIGVKVWVYLGDTKSSNE